MARFLTKRLRRRKRRSSIIKMLSRQVEKPSKQLELIHPVLLVRLVLIIRTSLRLLVTIVTRKGIIQINTPSLGRRML